MLNIDREVDRRDDINLVTESEDSHTGDSHDYATAAPAAEDAREAGNTDTFRDPIACLEKENLASRLQEKVTTSRDLVARRQDGGQGKLRTLACSNVKSLRRVFDGLRSRPYTIHINLDKKERKAYNSTLRKRYHRFRILYARMIARKQVNKYAPPESFRSVDFKTDSARHQRLSPQEQQARRRRRQELANALQQKTAAHMASLASLECVATRRSDSMITLCG